MTLTLELTAEQEKKLSDVAALNGVDERTYVMQYLFGEANLPSEGGSLADRLRNMGVLGAIEEKPRSDGRKRSEIEAAAVAPR